MDPNAIAAMVAAVAAIVSAIMAIIALRPAMRAAKAAEEQSRIQRELMQEAAQPHIWADIQPDSKQGHLLHLVVGNSGPTVAKNVQVTIDPPLPTQQKSGGYTAEIAQERLRDGILSLAPGRTICWSLGLGSEFLKEEHSDKVYRIEVTGDGLYQELPPQTFEVRPRDWRESLDAPDGSLHGVREELKALTKEVKGIRTAMTAVESA